MAHTPGPWVWTGGGGRTGLVAAGLDTADGNGVMTAVRRGADEAVLVFNMADAHLIAAAPELLEALKQLLREAKPCVGYGNGRILLDRAAAFANQAIAKAEGKDS